MAKIYYVGDWAVLLGPHFAETPFQSAQKGLEIFNYGTWLKNALESNGKNQVDSVPSWDFYKLPPGKYEQILSEYDVIIFSDVEGKLFQLNPDFFDKEEFGKRVITYPDRIRLTLEAVKSGKGLMMLGGWYSFTGEMGKGGWGRTMLRELLPVKCLDYEDLVESTEGFYPEVTEEGRSHFEGRLEDIPPILGYNQTLPIPEGKVLMSIKDTGDPLVALRKLGKGKVLAYTSDPAPHWGLNFVYWKHYNDFWLKCLDLVL
ncbi:MAG: glutamine amidotransferase [Prolixibacteraceae bacterium]|nr:glutamine amidotransferase [Prolixibacteraceae bacterium]